MERMSPKQRARFKARGVEHPTSTFLPPSSSSKSTPRRADTGPDQATVEVVIERDGGSCVVCGEGVSGTRGLDYSIHHRKRRSQGGDNRLSNLVLVHGHGTAGCHGRIHKEIAKAQEGGWLLLSTDEPERVPMAHHVYAVLARRFLLDNEGGLTPTDRRPEVG